jgi:hypothetical protein
MNLRHWLPVILVISIPAAAYAQQHRPNTTGARASVQPGKSQSKGGQAGHAFEGEAMMQQWRAEQMMMNQMLRQTHGNRRAAVSHGGAGKSSSGGTDSAGPHPGLASTHPDLDQSGQLMSSGSAPRRSAPHNALSNNQIPDAARQRPHGTEGATEKNQIRTTKPIAGRRLPADAETIGHLRSVHAKLEAAEGDYEDHRALAMKHIAAAIRHLGSSSTLITNVEGGGARTKAESDQLLREALLKLNSIELSLGTGAPDAQHHHSARASISDAIRELNAALTSS